MDFDTKTGFYKDSKPSIEKVARKYNVEISKDGLKTINELKNSLNKKGILYRPNSNLVELQSLAVRNEISINKKKTSF